jgi:hypothetical protein
MKELLELAATLQTAWLLTTVTNFAKLRDQLVMLATV